nr:prepilin-type N-terminal cleavage/methylation domain-containing protein [Oscillospiraceae bacterium]
MTKFERRRSGFTLIETMVVVAIIVILAAVAAAGLTDYASSLTHLERMNSAKAIYITAQNRLVNLKTRNQLSMFQEVSLSQYYTESEAQDDDGTVIPGLFYVDENDTAVIDELMPEGTISSDVRNDSYYYIDFDPVNGYIYGVFFSDKNFSYSDVSGIRGDETALKRAEVGYYGQSSLANINGSVVKLSPAFTVTNGEELYVTAKYTNYFVSETAAANWELSITMDGVVSGESHTFQTTPADVQLSGNTVTIEFVIDSLESGMGFNEQFGALGYEPGERLNLTAQMTYTGSVVTATPSDNRSLGSANSLYENVIGADVHVSTGRHLQNLSEAVSGVSCAGTLSAEAVTTITFTSDIDWVNGTLSYYSDKYGSSGDIDFELLENEAFFGTTGVSSGVTIAGGKHIISNVTVSTGISSSCAGFFPVLNLGTGKVTNLLLQ